MKTSSYQNWIKHGYENFAHKGPDGIIIENIANELGVSKSTFYHHFGNQQYFIEMLLEEHLERVNVLAKEARGIVSFIPDFANLLLKHKTAVLFHKQLRIHREEKLFQLHREKAELIIQKELHTIWKKFIDAHMDDETAKKLFNILEDMFYHRLTEENFNIIWMKNLAYELKTVVENLRKA